MADKSPTPSPPDDLVDQVAELRAELAELQRDYDQLGDRLDQVIDLVAGDLSTRTRAQLGKLRSTSKTQQRKRGS